MNDDRPEFQLEVVLRGPTYTREDSYGERADRDILARLDVPVDGPRGWQIYQAAVSAVTAPDPVLRFPALSAEEAGETLRKWTEKQRRRR